MILENFKVIDLTHRLPGPLGGKVLSDLGAQVIKVEDENFKDPFLSGLFNQSDNHFLNWYKELNSQKEVVRFDFKCPEAKSLMAELLKDSKVLLLAGPQKINDLLGITKENIQKNFPDLTVIELKAGDGEHKNLHDLNALALAGLLNMHTESREEKVIRPPFLPISGISFGHWVATKALAAVIGNKRWVDATLQEATEKILLPFKSSDKGIPRYLHNGKFPCYCLYKTTDNGVLAIAAVEDKFWKRFIELFGLELKMDDRFDTSDKIFNIISNKVSSMSNKEIVSLIEGEDICLTLI